MSQQIAKRPAAFIDRDGTLIEEVNFLSSVDQLSVFPYTAEALRLLKASGFYIVVVTNQSGIGRGLYTEDDMNAVHAAIQERLDGAIDRFYHCPHLPDAGCECRKPGLGMIKSAQSELDIDLANSWMIGDKKLDIMTGHAAGIRSAMVLTGYGAEHSLELDQPADITAGDLLLAVHLLMNQAAAGEP